MELTKSAKGSIAVIYTTYKKRRKKDIPKSEAIYFDESSKDFVENYNKVSEDLGELHSAKMIKENIIGGFTLLDSAIIYMENQSKETIKEWTSFITQFIP